MIEDSRMTGVGGHGASGATEKLWRIAVLTTAGALGTASQAAAAAYYWSDTDSGYSRPGPTVQKPQKKSRNGQAKKTAAPEKEASKPQGPLIISISIEKQKLRIYDANGFYAESPISTGMKGHPTPMGVFSVIQKQKLHHSNIYSGAPMPYMQRITWSGIAIHAGVLPGYPASHGCIRMPMAFAMKMWNWTKMGARVVVTPGEMTPSSFSHPLLVAQKVVPPQPTAANEPPADAPPAAKSDKASDAAAKPATSEANLELRPTVGHSDSVRSAADQPPAASAALRDQTHTADASSDMQAGKASMTMSDASGRNASPREEASAATDGSAGDAAKADVKSEDAAKPEAATPGETASSEDKPADTKSPEAATADRNKADVAEAAVPASGDVAKVEAPATASVTAAAKSDESKTEEKKPDAVSTNAKPDASPAAATDNNATAAVKKDLTRLPEADKAPVAKPDPAASAPKRTGQIAVFVSRKDAKLYVRQNFAPLFDVPVTIASSDRPLGTHVFTAQVDKNDANVLHWSVVTLPVPARYAERRDEDDRALRRRKIAGAVEMKPLPVPDSPAEALDRITIPADAMARITDVLSTGASIIVSDQGINAGETGEGTDFIVSLR
jgi:lipoprotein-anchoring transpeptidase ErfK/SrfK